MKNVRLMVPDYIHAKMHQVCSLAGVPVTTGYISLALHEMDYATDMELVRILKICAPKAIHEQDPALVREPAPVEA